MTKFAFQAAARKCLLWLLAVMLALPVMALLQMVSGGCAEGRGICHYAAILYVFVAPIFFIFFCVRLLWTIGRRVHRLGMSSGWTVAAAIWLLAAGPVFAFGVVLLSGGVLIKRFDQLPTGLLAQPLPIVLFLLTFIAFLWRAEPEHARPDTAMRRWALIVAAVAAAQVTILHVGPALSMLHKMLFLRPLQQRLLVDLLDSVAMAASFGISPAFRYWIYWIDFTIFSVVLAYVVTRPNDREAPPGSSAVMEDAGRPSPSPRRWGLPPKADFGRRRS